MWMVQEKGPKPHKGGLYQRNQMPNFQLNHPVFSRSSDTKEENTGNQV